MTSFVEFLEKTLGRIFSIFFPPIIHIPVPCSYPSSSRFSPHLLSSKRRNSALNEQTRKSNRKISFIPWSRSIAALRRSLEQKKEKKFQNFIKNEKEVSSRKKNRRRKIGQRLLKHWLISVIMTHKTLICFYPGIFLLIFLIIGFVMLPFFSFPQLFSR